MQKKYLSGLVILSLLVSCGGSDTSNKETPADTAAAVSKDTMKVPSDTVGTKSNAVAPPTDNIDDAMAMIVEAFKSDSDNRWDKFDAKYIDKKTGVYEIYLVGDYNKSIDQGTSMAQLDGGDGPGPDALADLREVIRAAKPEMLKVQVIDQVDVMACDLKKPRATTVVVLTHTPGIIEEAFRSKYEATEGNPPTDKQADPYASLDYQLSMRLILDIYNKDDKAFRRKAEFYFSMGDNKLTLMVVKVGFNCNENAN